jgi:hypothetical protein
MEGTGMKTFVIVMFCLFVFNTLATLSRLYKGYYPKKIIQETDFISLIINIGFLVWTSVLLFG